MGSTDVVETVRYKLKGGVPTVFGGITEMQQMTKEICDAAKVGEYSWYNPATGQGTRVKDVRDGEEYTIAKLADGKCWMTENLRLKLNADTLPLKGTSADGKTSDLPEGTEWNPGSEVYTQASITYNNNSKGMVSWNTGNGYGTYWQWNAVTAGQGSSVTSYGTNTDQSVCPKGWRLPTTGDFGTLVGAYGGTSDSGNTVAKLAAVPANFTYSGYVYNGSPNGVGSYGNYWSSTSYSSTDACYLDLASVPIRPSRNTSRSLGMPVRCVAR